VHCAAEVSFNSLICFRISTKLLLNWFGSRVIHISLKFKLTELKGTLIFGVSGNQAELLFANEPVIGLSVTPELGDGDCINLSRVPKLAEVISKVMKYKILERLLFPNRLFFPLPWEKIWSSIVLPVQSCNSTSTDKKEVGDDEIDPLLLGKILNALAVDKNDNLFFSEEKNLDNKRSGHVA